MKVTACVIVKNEEKNIGSWLESARRLSDEMVVVDTGSEDRTKELAAAGGARVLDFPWCNDFSAAKNFALDNAEGDWIVFLDADETIRENDAPRVRQAMERYLGDTRVMGFVCRLVDYDPKEPEVEKGDCYQIRIFRCSRSIRYEGRIHEHLVDAARSGRTAQLIPDVTIWHSGYAEAVRPEKFKRNLQILLEEQAKGNVQPMDAYYLADCYFGLGDYMNAAKYAVDAIGTGLMPMGLSNRPDEVLLVSLLRLGRPREEIDAALAISLERHPKLPVFHFFAGDFAWERKDYDTAEREWKKGLELLSARERGENVDVFASRDMEQVDKIKEHLAEIEKMKESEKPMTYREVREEAQKMRGFAAKGDTARALETAAKILKAKPENRELMEEVCVLFLDAEDTEKAAEAAECLKVAEKPYGYGCFLLASVRFLQKNMKEAQSFAERALSFGGLLEWQKGAVHHLLAELAKARGDRKTAAEEYLLSSSFKEIETGMLADYSNYLLSLSFFENSDEKLLQAAKEYGKLLGTVPQYKHDEKHHRHDKLRIGYISPDFRRHIVACFSRAFFRSADRACFDVYGYSLCDENDVSRIFAAEADGFRYIKGLSAKDAAALIYKDEIDILVDLSGHTGDNALPILAYKPAPVQISGVGWFRTTGLAAVDYFLADEASAPTGEEAQFTEKLIRLPHSHLCFTPILEAKSYPAPCRKAGHVTFGCFNQFDKVTDEMLSVWAEILRLVPGSKLFLKGSVFDRRERTDEIAKRLTEAGISMESVELEGYTDKYLDAYGRVDIALDTYPYPGGGTTCDALYMGVPVVTLSGSHHHTRFGTSLLKNIGLDKLCADSREKYVEAAVSLAENQKELSHLHQTIRRRMKETSVMNEKQYMTELEEAYASVWHEWEKVHSPHNCAKNDSKTNRLLNEAEAKKDWKKAVRIVSRMEAAGVAGDAERYLAAKAYYNMQDYERALYWASGIKERTLWAHDIHCMEIWSLKSLGRFREAYEVCKAELASEIKNEAESGMRDWTLGIAGWLAYSMGLSDAPEQYLRASEESKSFVRKVEMYSSYLLAQNAVDTNEQELFEAHLRYGDFFRDVKQYTHKKHVEHKKLRIGYISSDFRQHVMVHFAWPFLTAYDRSRFEVHVYSLTGQEDGYSEALRKSADAWTNLAGQPWEKIAKRIYDDEIDILVDLAGHSTGSGLPVLAHKPAPVQVSGLGYMATTGLSTVDYYLTDGFVDIEGAHEQLFTEKLLRLTSQFCYAPLGKFPVPNGAPSKERGWVLFGVFNHFRKVTDEMLLAWRRILEAVPNSKLLMKSQIFFSPQNVDDAFERMEAAGLDMDRVIFEPATMDYMERYLDVDIALDTYPYPGGGTTADALYMGVPVITMYSDRRSSRFAYGMMAAVGLEGLTVETTEDYVARAVGLASDVELLDILHKRLRSMMESSPLMNAGQYMAEVEAAYEKIWKERRVHEG